MAFCGNCGAKVDDGVKFCPSCGAAIEAAAEQKTEQTEQPKQTAQNNLTEKLQSFNNTADSTEEFDAQDIEQNKFMGILAYLSWLVLIPIFAAKNSRFARFHANQGLVLAIVEIVWWIATAILTSIGYAIAWWLGSLLSTVLGLVNIIFLILLFLGIVNAANGRAKELPIIGKFRILK